MGTRPQSRSLTERLLCLSKTKAHLDWLVLCVVVVLLFYVGLVQLVVVSLISQSIWPRLCARRLSGENGDVCAASATRQTLTQPPSDPATPFPPRSTPRLDTSLSLVFNDLLTVVNTLIIVDLDEGK